MSFSLSISGHHNDADAYEVENLVKAGAKTIVEGLAELGLEVHVSFSGATSQGPSLEPVDRPEEPVVEEPAVDEVVEDVAEPVDEPAVDEG